MKPVPFGRPGVKLCSWKGCSTWAKYQVGFKLYGAPKGTPGTEPAQAVLDIYICEADAPKVKIEHLISNEAWPSLVAVAKVAGKVEPIREETEIMLIELNQKEDP